MNEQEYNDMRELERLRAEEKARRELAERLQQGAWYGLVANLWALVAAMAMICIFLYSIKGWL